MMHLQRPSRRTVLVAGFVAVLLAVAAGVFVMVSSPDSGSTAAAAPGEGRCGRTWVAAWGASPTATYAPDAPHGSLDGRTLRLVARVQADGDQVRFRLSNRYGREPLTIGAATAGIAREQPYVRPVEPTLEGMRAVPVTFGGQRSVVVAPGADVVSDPAVMNVQWRDPVAVSLFLPGPVYMVTEHSGALQTSYLSGPGDFTGDPNGAPFTKPLQSWPILDGIEVRAPRAMNVVLLVGDSITDGVGAGLDEDQRFSDALADRLRLPGGSPQSVVINWGLSGNQLLADSPESTGDSPTTRILTGLPLGVTDVILQIGNNDIARGEPVRAITDGMTRFVEQARARGVRVFLTTVTPSTASPYGTPAANDVRRQVNDWVRAGGPVVADGVFDFAQAVDAQDQPTRIGEMLDSGDGIHLSPAGYKALARDVDLVRLSPPPCP